MASGNCATVIHRSFPTSQSDLHSGPRRLADVEFVRFAVTTTIDPSDPPSGSNRAVPDTHQKALAVNLDATSFGSFAEIGAGQEVARWLLRVGGLTPACDTRHIRRPRAPAKDVTRRGRQNGLNQTGCGWRFGFRGCCSRVTSDRCQQ